MKSIILLALFALAANAAFNLTAYGIGQSEQFGFDDAQIEDGIQCFNALQTDLDNLVELVETKDITTILSGISAWYEQYNTDLQTACKAYATDVATYILSKINTTDIAETMEENFEKYWAEVIQQIALQINDLIAGNDEAAGVAKAYNDQILLGLITPNTLPAPQFNVSQYVPFNYATFSVDYFSALFATINMSPDVDGSEIESCLTQLATFTQDLEYLIGNFSNYTFAEKIQGISDFFELSGDTLATCEYYEEIFHPISTTLLPAFEANPASFVLQVANNIAMNAPQLVQSAQQEEVYILEGEYTLAGEEKGKRLVEIFGFAGL